MKTMSEKLNISYRKENGIKYPNLALPYQTDYQIDKYGQMRLDF